MASILVVDDENLVRGIVEEILTSQGHEVIQATSGNEAIKMCGERTFDLVISDLSMPLMNGFDLISALRRLQKNLPVLAIPHERVDAVVAKKFNQRILPLW